MKYMFFVIFHTHKHIELNLILNDFIPKPKYVQTVFKIYVTSLAAENKHNSQFMKLGVRGYHSSRVLYLRQCCLLLSRTHYPGWRSWLT